ncbi:hypothetical protein ACOQFO_12975 [Ureibacillus sp. MALMAid1270]|uniref:hypothetical protein n=1 Tax=Ureibacillus sp. MALMAid1270 TaxID=3411629 RepID=UPI003BA5BA44
MKDKLNNSLGSWEKEAAQVKHRIYQETIYKQQKNPKRPFFKPLISVATLFLFIIGAVFLTALLLSEDSSELAKKADFRMYDQRTVEITKYEMFYRKQTFFSKEAVEFHALYETLEKFALFHYLEQHDYQWDEERRNTFRERVKMALDYDMKIPELKSYYEKMFTELQITADEYIDYYLLVNKEYEMLKQDLFDKNIGTEDGSYSSGEAFNEYLKLVNITEKDLDELAERIPERLEPMDPQPDLPFNNREFEFYVTTNEKGEYIFVHVSDFNLITPTYYSLIFEIERDIVKEPLTRHSFKRYQEVFRTYQSDDAEKVKLSKELEAILEILERSIEMEYVPS